MKRCLKCSRVYADEELNFCLDDGEWLVGEGAQSDAPTAIMSGDSGAGEFPTRRQVSDAETTHVDQPTSSAEYIVKEVKRHRVGAVLGIAVIEILLGAGLLLFWSGRLSSSGSASVPFQSMNITKMTSTGRATNAAISPDGRYVVHVMDENGKQSVWTRQVKIASASQKIIEAQDVFYWGLDPTSPFYNLAHLGVARAAMITGDSATARTEYQNFFAAWKDADQDLPVLIEAKKEYEQIK